MRAWLGTTIRFGSTRVASLPEPAFRLIRQSAALLTRDPESGRRHHTQQNVTRILHADNTEETGRSRG